MSIVDDQIRRLDGLLDRLQIASAEQQTGSTDADQVEPTVSHPQDNVHTSHLKTAIRALSATAGPRPLLQKVRLRGLLEQIIQEQGRIQGLEEDVEDSQDLAWLATAKAAVQLYGLILNNFLEQTIPLVESIWYWDDVLGSYPATALYTVQTAPIRFWAQAKEVYTDAKGKYLSTSSFRETAHESRQTLAHGWHEFYDIVQDSMRNRSLAQARTRILSPFAICRTEARKKQKSLKRLRETGASSIGLLVDEGLALQPFEDENQVGAMNNSEWRQTITKSVSLFSSILLNATTAENTIPEFEESVFAGVENDTQLSTGAEANDSNVRPAQVAQMLIRILDQSIPEQEREFLKMSTEYGKPSRLVRYWIPGVALLLSGSTLLRIFANRRAEIIQWVSELGTTITDFWMNWVIEPTKKLIGTIRHDEQSEVAIMSRDSLNADRASLERMVVDFAVDHPEGGAKYTETEIASIREKVKAGDLTAVLKAYERDMQSPIWGSIRGDLVRALLIQVQKTKVDVEVAIGGIDALLKSQELLFGFVGIAPGVFISYLVIKWLMDTFGTRRGLKQIKEQGQTIRVLRNIDRTLTTATPTDTGMLSYKDHGLLLCEVHILRQLCTSVLPGNVSREFLEDVNDLMDIRIGVQRQQKVLERTQWAYAKWLK